MLMAIYFKDMDDREKSDLTMSIVHSGEEIDLSAIKGIFDKGVTIWHTDSVGDYSLSNNEV